MNQNRALKKVFNHDTGGTHTSESLLPSSEESWLDEPQAELYAKASPPIQKKHSTRYINQRRKVRHLAEARLINLSMQLVKLADEIRYYDPLMAEVLDEAWDATEEAISMMQDEE